MCKLPEFVDVIPAATEFGNGKFYLYVSDKIGACGKYR